MTYIYLIRHGATGKREKDQIAGDVLNGEGRDMVEALGERLVGEGIAKIYASPYVRAWQTAELINRQLQVPLEQRPELKEIALFKSPLELKNPWQKREFQLVEKLLATTWEGLDELMQDVLTEHRGQTVAWVCHGNLIRAILVGALRLPLVTVGQLQVDLASLTILAWDEKYEYFLLDLFNDTCHLK